MTAGLCWELHGFKRLSTGACSMSVGVQAHLAKLLCILSSIRTGRIHKCDDGEAKVVRMLHEAQRLAVAVRLRHPKVPENVLLHVWHSVCKLPRLSLAGAYHQTLCVATELRWCLADAML